MQTNLGGAFRTHVGSEGQWQIFSAVVCMMLIAQAHAFLAALRPCALCSLPRPTSGVWWGQQRPSCSSPESETTRSQKRQHDTSTLESLWHELLRLTSVVRAISSGQTPSAIIAGQGFGKWEDLDRSVHGLDASLPRRVRLRKACMSWHRRWRSMAVGHSSLQICTARANCYSLLLDSLEAMSVLWP